MRDIQSKIILCLLAFIAATFLISESALSQSTPEDSPKPKYKIIIGYPSALFRDGGHGNNVRFESINGKMHIDYKIKKEPPHGGFLSYSFSIYDFATQSEKKIDIQLISKQAKDGHVFEDGIHPIKELSGYTISSDQTSPDGYTFVEKNFTITKDGRSIPLIAKEYTQLADKVPLWLKEDEVGKVEEVYHAYETKKYTPEKKLEGTFYGWIITEE